MENLYIIKKFLFIDNNIINKNPYSSHNIKKLEQNLFIIIKFHIYLINLRFMINLNHIFIYNFYKSIYLINKEYFYFQLRN